MTQSFSIVSASVSDRGLSQKRPQNEDAFLEMPQCGIYAVADGVGGAQAGEVASQMAMEILGEAFVNVDTRSDPENVMRAALMRANAAIHQMSQELPQLAQMATTVVALHLKNGIATIGHAGDSRAYRLDARGILHRETADHSLVAEEVRAGRMTQEQAESHPGKNIINRALGAESTVEIETKTILIGEPSVFMMCSDGVTRHINDNEIAILLRSGAPPSTICERIKSICYERGAEDNLTAVVIQLANAEASPVNGSSNVSPIAEKLSMPGARTGVAKDSLRDDDEDLLGIESRVPVPVSDDPDDIDLFSGDQAASTAGHSSPESNLITANTSPTFSDQPTVDPNDEVLELDLSVPDTEDLEVDPLEVEQSESVRSNKTKEGSAGRIEGSDGYADTASVPADQTDTDPPHAISSGDRLVEPAPAPASAADRVHAVISGQDEEGVAHGSNFSARVFSSAALLLLGSLIGLTAYHFLLADRTPTAVAPAVEMKMAKQPQTAFEENRRTLDKNPAAALPRYEAEPKDAENRFLLGRTYLLLGRYPEARKAFQESKELVAAGQVDPDNAYTILTEIAIAMAVTNDTLVQNSLKKELDEARAGTSNTAVTTPAH